MHGRHDAGADCIMSASRGGGLVTDDSGGGKAKPTASSCPPPVAAAGRTGTRPAASLHCGRRTISRPTPGCPVRQQWFAAPLGCRTSVDAQADGSIQTRSCRLSCGSRIAFARLRHACRYGGRLGTALALLAQNVARVLARRSGKHPQAGWRAAVPDPRFRERRPIRARLSSPGAKTGVAFAFSRSRSIESLVTRAIEGRSITSGCAPEGDQRAGRRARWR